MRQKGVRVGSWEEGWSVLNWEEKNIINNSFRPGFHIQQDKKKNLTGIKLAKAKGKVLQPAPHLAGTKEQLFLLEPCFWSVQYSPHSFKQKTRREGNTSCLLRKFIFKNKRRLTLLGEPACCTPKCVPGLRDLWKQKNSSYSKPTIK